MRPQGFLISLALVLTAAVNSASAASLGAVVPIGGHASDIVLDESRNVLYIANFTANRIEVMSTADYSIRTSMNVAAQPGSLTISPDYQFLLVTHYGNFTTAGASKNGITLINLNDNTRQTFAFGDTPLAAAFVADGRALIVTSANIVLFDPLTGFVQSVASLDALAKQLPTPIGTLPAQVIQATLATNADRTSVYGIADDTNFQAFYRFDVKTGSIFAIGVTAVPKPLPRISVSDDGSWAILNQYRIDGTAHDLAQFPNAITSTKIGGAAVDSKAGLIYAQILVAAPASAPSSSLAAALNPAPAADAQPATPPVLSVLDADNLNVRERLSIPENIIGRSILNGKRDILYAITESGVTVIPVGRLDQQHRLAAAQSDVVVSGNFCNRNVLIQKLTITDPGGGNTDFSISWNQPGVTVSPSSGVTPATVLVRVDRAAFQNQNGTVAVNLNLSSYSGVNLPAPVRLLMNNRNPDQRGTVLNIPGTLTDLLADPARNRFYVVRQDTNEVLVFDASTYAQIATLRTSSTPTQMAITFDRKRLVVGHDNSQFAYVYDLDTLQPETPIQFPPGHYPRSIAESGNSMLALVRNVAGDAPGSIDRIDILARKAVQLPSLGIYTNNVNPGGVLAPAPNGGSILVAMPDGNVMLYDANADTFTVSRKDFAALSGAYAASSYNTYVVGNNVLNASLVAQSTLESTSGSPAAFAFVDQWGMRTTAAAVSSPGVIQHVDPSSILNAKPTRMVEAPLGTSAAQPFIRSLAPLYDRSAVVSLTVSGITVLPWNYDAAVAPPRITSVVNAADGARPVAPGGLITIYGQQMSPVNIATKEIPLPTALGESCLTVNGIAVPMLFVSSQQINGQLPFNVDGNAVMTLRTPGGISDNFNFSILPAAPSIFRSGTAGPQTGLATVIRADNGLLVTPTNPIHPSDTVIIYATGLGRTSPPLDAGLPAPSDPLTSALIAPAVTLGGVPLNVTFAGLVPGQVGVYQINATVPGGVPLGLEIPLAINQAGTATSLAVRVVK